MFFIKKKKIILDAFVSEGWIYNNNPIQSSSKFIPKWFKNSKPFYTDDGYIPKETLKQCPAISSLIMKGITLPLWTDYAFKYDHDNKEIKWGCGDTLDGYAEAETHDAIQWESFADKTRYFHFKIISPWLFRTKEDIDFYWDRSYFNQKLEVPYSTVPGIINYQRQTGTHINMFIDMHKLTKNEHGFYTFNIEAASPVAQLIPLSERNVEVKNHLVSKTEYRDIQNNYKKVFFTNNYKKIKKCPFHKG